MGKAMGPIRLLVELHNYLLSRNFKLPDIEMQMFTSNVKNTFFWLYFSLNLIISAIFLHTKYKLINFASQHGDGS